VTRSRILLTCLIVVALAIVVSAIAYSAVACFRVGPLGDTVLRSLNQEEIGPMLKSLTGKELPAEVENLRAITYSHRTWRNQGWEELHVAFQVDKDGYRQVLDEFGGGGVEKYTFPGETNPPGQWYIDTFDQGYHCQTKLGVSLFDKGLYHRIQDDYWRSLADSGRYPQDAITGHDLRFALELKKDFTGYRVLMFDDAHIVYISAGRRTKDFHTR